MVHGKQKLIVSLSPFFGELMTYSHFPLKEIDLFLLLHERRVFSLKTSVFQSLDFLIDTTCKFTPK